MKVYYAHFMGIYNTPQEDRDLKTLNDLGLDVVNPNTPETQDEVKNYPLTHASGNYMDMFDLVFFSKIRDCEVFAFRALPDGRIPGGVAMELNKAQKYNKIIIELPCGTFSRSMGKEDTQEYLRDIGER